MKIGVLTSSRADYGIYLPLLKKLKDDDFFQLEIIAFGTHLSKNHGFTLNNIEVDGFENIHKIETLVEDDSPKGIVKSYALTISEFSNFWNFNAYDIVFCLGDRFEMSAAVQAGIPFGVQFAHIHGGETTLGAIDNIYRHQISLASKLHFVASQSFKNKLVQLLDTDKNIYTVGALSLDELANYKPIEKQLFYHKYNLKDDFALITFHPETVAFELNIEFANQMYKGLESLTSSLHLVITMPNADTLGSIYRKEIEALKTKHPDKVILIENFGKENYFSAMYYAKVLIGNTSSGIIEAASFGKYVVNVGDRQKGRVQSANIFNAEFNASDMVSKTNEAIARGVFKGNNVYYKEGAANLIIETLKQL